MTSRESGRGLWLLLVAVLTLGGCAHSSAGSDPDCRGERWIESRLFFGRDIFDGRQVTEEMWHGFVDQVVAPLLSNGFTVIDGIGFWLDETTGKTENERSKILVVLHPRDSDLRQKLNEIAEAYIGRFEQQAVLADSRTTCVVFYEDAPQSEAG